MVEVLKSDLGGGFVENIIFHIDVNSAYLSWTAVKLLKEGVSIDIRTVPCIIGGDKEKRHGIVLAKSIPAKKYGIVTGEPVVDAFRKCPNLMTVPPEHEYYHEQSKKFINILKEYTPDIEQVSVDECYMDFTGIQKQFASPIEAANIFKDRIKKELGFTVNIGISDRKVLAKMASDFEKPDKVHTLYFDEIQRKMWPLPVEDLFMAGKSSVVIFHKLGIYTIGQLAKTPVTVLEYHLKSHGRMLWKYANGMDNQGVSREKEELKGIGNSTTLAKDVDNLNEIHKVLLMLSDKVSGRIRAAHQKAQVVCVEIKYSDFTKVSRQTTVEKPVNTGNEIYQLSYRLFGEIWTGKPVRLLGIRTGKLIDEDEPEQMNIFDFGQDFSFSDVENQVSMEEGNSAKSKSENIIEKAPSREKIQKLEAALDSIKKKYGDGAVSRASLLKDSSEDINF